MLNRDDILKILKDLPFKTDFWVNTGAALVLHGVKNSTNDIDLGCSSFLFEQLISNGIEYKVEPDSTRSLKLSDTIEIFENWFVEEIELIEGIPVASLHSIIKQKQALGREKDFKDIVLIEKFIRDRGF